jgi:hypothetical protein
MNNKEYISITNVVVHCDISNINILYIELMFTIPISANSFSRITQTKITGTSEWKNIWKYTLVVILMSQLTENYLAFQSLDFEHAWWGFFQRRVERTKLDFYVCITNTGLIRLLMEY